MCNDAPSAARDRRAPVSRRRRAPLAATCFPALLAAVLAVAAGAARADICRYIDGEGNTHYSNLPPEKGWRKLGCTVGDDPTVRRSGTGAAARGTPSPPGFPRVDLETQKSRDDIRRKVLGDELAAEEKLLAEARALHAEGAPTPLPEERADAEKYRVRIARLRQSVIVHERNIEALKKELATIK
jgi:hypothetical protein